MVPLCLNPDFRGKPLVAVVAVLRCFEERTNYIRVFQQHRSAPSVTTLHNHVPNTQKERKRQSGYAGRSILDSKHGRHGQVDKARETLVLFEKADPRGRMGLPIHESVDHFLAQYGAIA